MIELFKNLLIIVFLLNFFSCGDNPSQPKELSSNLAMSRNQEIMQKYFYEGTPQMGEFRVPQLKATNSNLKVSFEANYSGANSKILSLSLKSNLNQNISARKSILNFVGDLDIGNSFSDLKGDFWNTDTVVFNRFFKSSNHLQIKQQYIQEQFKVLQNSTSIFINLNLIGRNLQNISNVKNIKIGLYLSNGLKVDSDKIFSYVVDQKFDVDYKKNKNGLRLNKILSFELLKTGFDNDTLNEILLESKRVVAVVEDFDFEIKGNIWMKYSDVDAFQRKNSIRYVYSTPEMTEIKYINFHGQRRDFLKQKYDDFNLDEMGNISFLNKKESFLESYDQANLRFWEDFETARSSFYGEKEKKTWFVLYMNKVEQSEGRNNKEYKSKSDIIENYKHNFLGTLSPGGVMIVKIAGTFLKPIFKTTKKRVRVEGNIFDTYTSRSCKANHRTYVKSELAAVVFDKLFVEKNLELIIQDHISSKKYFISEDHYYIDSKTNYLYLKIDSDFLQSNNNKEVY